MLLDYARRGWRMLSSPVRYRIMLALTGFLLLAGLEIFGISLILPVLTLLVEPQLLSHKPLLASVYTSLGFSSHRQFLGALLALMCAAIIGKNLGAMIVYRWQFRFLADAQANLSKRLFGLYVRMPYLDYLERDTGFFTYTVSALGGVFFSSFVQQSLILVTECVTLTLLIAVLVAVNPVATGFAGMLLALCGVTIYWVTTPRLREIGHRNRVCSEQALRVVKETFGGFKEIRVLGRGGRFADAFGEIAETLADCQARQATYSMLNRHIIEIVLVTCIALVAGITLSNTHLGDAVGQLSLFGTVTLRILPSTSRIISALQMLHTCESPLALLYEELDHSGRWALESDAAIRAPAPGGGVVASDLRLEKVGFAYQGSALPAIRDLDLDLPFGAVIGVAGPSGSGKSTLADLILGVVPPGSGRILCDGADIYHAIGDWRRKVAYVPQRIAFVSGSVKENVAFGLSADEIDEARVARCLDQAQLHEKLRQLPQGMHQRLGEDGNLLSGGEKQRLGIARALYQDASVMVLDEATSALDMETEERLAAVIRSLRGRLTVVVIAHRLATLRDCDQIIFLENGGIVARGDFEHLFNAHPRFRRMVELSRVEHRRSA